MEEKKVIKKIKRDLPRITINLMIIFLLCLFIMTLLIRNMVGMQKVKKLEEKAIEKINIIIPSNEVGRGYGIKISKQIFPINAFVSNLNWVIENPDIVRIDNDVLYANSLGETKIYLTDGKIKSNILNIKSIELVERLQVDNPINSLALSTEYEYKMKYFPESGDKSKIHITTSNPEVIEVRGQNKIFAKKVGEATIKIMDRGRELYSTNIKVEGILIN